jgi:hypothetical protein
MFKNILMNKNKLNFYYNIDNFLLLKVKYVHNLGIILQSNFIFTNHID